MALEYIYMYINSDCIFSVLLLISVSCVLLPVFSYMCVYVLSVTDNALFHIQLSTDIGYGKCMYVM